MELHISRGTERYTGRLCPDTRCLMRSSPNSDLGLFRCLLGSYLLKKVVYYLIKTCRHIVHIQTLLEGVAQAEWAADSQVQS